MIGLRRSASILKKGGNGPLNVEFLLSHDAFQTSTKDYGNGNHDKVSLSASDDRGVINFFNQFLPASTTTAESTSRPPQLQPMAVLQSRYSTVQHKIDKQAPHESIKTWFEDTSDGDNHDLWWRSKIRVPEN
eukprot:scaffold31504_cov36-Cyclotella_meneghiniana.AAC.1